MNIIRVIFKQLVANTYTGLFWAYSMQSESHVVRGLYSKVFCAVYGTPFLFFSTAFTPFRSCYYLLYQCLVPNPREGLSLLVQHCNVPDNFERTILSGGIPRLCNQGVLNYLLIILRRDKDFVKFWNVVKLLIDQPELRKAVERIQKGHRMNKSW